MRILIASSEIAPFSKTGGLADVCRALPSALHRLGHDVSMITPAYRCVLRGGASIEPTGITFDIPIGNKIVSGRLLRGASETGIPIYFVDQPDYFDRAELYREGGHDYDDNCERFVFFCRAVMESLRLLGGNFDIVHANDWQCGLIPAYLRLEYAQTRGYRSLASVFTIHNMAYQGTFWHWDMLLTGLDWRHFHWKQMEYYGQLNLLKTGLVFADALSTVSSRYAEEICEAPHGCGLEGVLQNRRSVMVGILNGVDYDDWNPEVDSNLSRNYSVDDWSIGKAENKRHLREAMGLPTSSDAPLIGIIGRLADQKGWDLIAEVLRRWAPAEEVQWAILGAGERKYVDLLGQLASEFPGRVAARFEFSEQLAHLIEAGADMFLMPSRYEPCGLNQMYSLKYGTVPIVRATGGLADTITDASPANLAAGTANGFAFESYDVLSLEETIHRACQMFRHDREQWRALVETGMRQDWSWDESAVRYVQLYEQALADKRVAAPV